MQIRHAITTEQRVLPDTDYTTAFNSSYFCCLVRFVKPVR